MNKLTSLYRWGNALSLDIALGAMACAIFFAHYIDVEPIPIHVVLLGLTVWVIYTGDHLFDAYQIKGQPSTYRHQFHRLHFIWLLTAFFLALAAIGAILFFVSQGTLRWGLVVLNVVILYMLLRKYLPFMKEVGVAMLFCAGVFLPAIIETGTAFSWILQPVAVLFFITALVNLLVFSWYEHAADTTDGFNSFAIYFGRIRTRQVVVALLAVQVAVATWGLLTNMPVYALFVLGGMNLTLLVIMLFPGFFGQNDRYRLIGDAIFFLPLAGAFF